MSSTSNNHRNRKLGPLDFQYQTIIDRAGIAVIVVDEPSGLILHANRWAETITGLKQGGLVESQESPSTTAAPEWFRDVIRESRNRENMRTCAISESPEFKRRKNRLLDIFVTRLGKKDSHLAILIRTVVSDRGIEKKLWHRNHELRVLNHASRTMSRSLDPHEVMRLAMKLSLELFEADAGIAYISDFEKSTLSPVAFSGLPEHLELEEIAFGGETAAATAFRSGQPVFCTNNTLRSQSVLQQFDRIATIPLQKGNVVLGILEIAADSKTGLDLFNDAVLLTSFGFQTGIALDNALLHRKVEEASRVDGLTGIYTRLHLETLLEDSVKRAKRYDEIFAVLMIDIDRFKSINDVHGHERGDWVLKRVVDVIKEEVRETDHLGRWGGEEFLVILSQVGWEEAFAIAERIRLGVAAKSFSEIIGVELPITISVGVACYPDHSETSDGLVRCADNAMLSAKKSGRNRTQLFHEKTGDVAAANNRWEFSWSAGMETIRALAAALDAKDSYTASHSEGVRLLAVKIAMHIGIAESKIQVLERAAMLHDIGKVAVPDSILNKPGALLPEELAIIREHPRMGVLILREAPQLSSIIPAVLHHHENYDGTGYPKGLVGSDIPLLSRILRVADSFMAMVSTRPYRKALTPKDAWQEIEQNSGQLFDPVVVDALAKSISHKRAS